ncbi:TetR/AcrR family transcriptional regulator [Actinoplanes sp. RD1]|uniref:TetR/AcrR family transcriptional regulator n=1 Tax=Actinoplanes sp. RD1 TaxID=3064538 RepID=UPI0027411E3C|nr:TetR family transcriptional regulator [Actinoplanes sp. RD1]
MAPDERRAALVRATIPLLHEFGMEVSTRQIAQAAGVAEGTIFGVFKDKNSLLVAAVTQALDPEPTLEALGTIDLREELRPRLARAVELIQARFEKNAQLMSAARKLVMAVGSHPEAVQRMISSRERLHAALVEVIAPDAARLRRKPGEVARLLLLYCGANTFGPFGESDRFHGAELVSLLLDGLLVRDPSDHGGAERC